MSEKEKYNKNVVTEPVTSVQTQEEFDEVLAAYAKRNPEKHAKKLADGSYARFRANLSGSKPVAAETASVETAETEKVTATSTIPVLKAHAEQNGIMLGGTEKKPELVALLKEKGLL